MQLKMKSSKKVVYDKLVTKVINVDTSGFILKTNYDTDKSDLEKKISDADKKIPDTSGKIPSISSIVTTTALIEVKNRIPAVSNLVKKKEIMMQKYQTLNLNILLRLIAIDLQMKNLI